MSEVLIFRGLERLLIEFGAIIAIGSGTLLFRWGIEAPLDLDVSTGDATRNPIRIRMLRASPGVVFCLLGTIILGIGIVNPVTIAGADGAIAVAASEKPKKDEPVAVYMQYGLHGVSLGRQLAGDLQSYRGGTASKEVTPEALIYAAGKLEQVCDEEIKELEEHPDSVKDAAAELGKLKKVKEFLHALAAGPKDGEEMSKFLERMSSLALTVPK